MEFMDNAYKLGSGRYLQEPHALDLAGAEVADVGSRALVVGGPTALGVAGEALAKSLDSTGVKSTFCEYEGVTSAGATARFADKARELMCDVIVGVGGGRIMDLAKAIGLATRAAVIEVPTSIATCAACTPLSVMYTEEGGFESCLRFRREVDAVIVDFGVMATQPARLVAAGVLDAMAKHIEISNGVSAEGLMDEDVQRFCAYEYARTNRSLLERLGPVAYKDVASHRMTPALQSVIFLSLAATGIVSCLTRSMRQSAVAHKLYDLSRTYFHEEVAPFLHGEIVAVGLLAQLHYNGWDKQIEGLRGIMRSMDMPLTLADLSINLDCERGRRLVNGIIESPFVQDDEAHATLLRESLDLVSGR